ncbi:MAG: helix-turn-helix domain-containing protein, partial [Pseudonocardiaceae bacterium]
VSGHTVRGAVIAMGYEDDDMVARQAGGTPAVDPALLARADVRAALAGHDIGALYRILSDNGWTQREIAKATRTQQSGVSEILRGRQVIDYRLLVRIADGLGIPRELMNLGPGAYAGDGAVAETPEGVSAEMRRRVLLAAAGIAVAGRPLQGIGELVGGLPGPAPVPLPARIFEVHVAKVCDLTRRLGEAGCTFGSDPEVSSAAAAWATRLLGVPGAEPVKQELRVAVAELHIHAGWAAFDGCLYDRAMQHYTQALELATEAGDAYCQALALNFAGLATEEHGHPNDGLKMLQYGQIKAWDIPADDQRTVVGEGSRAALEACGRADSATALARLGHWDAAYRELATSRELWQPTRTDPAGDLYYVVARLDVTRGRLDAAEPFAAASVRRWEGASQRARTQSSILLATIHVRAGEHGGLQLAHGALSGVTKLSSVRARRRLEPLVAALETRSGSDHRELARMARQVIATQA